MRLNLLLAAAVFLLSQTSFGQNDENIKVNVQKCLIAYSIKSIHASVQGGVVTLTGSVDLYSTRFLADQLTSGVPGVKSVWDRVEVLSPNVPDEELSKQVKNLIADRIRRLGGFGFGSISVNVKDGVVTLAATPLPSWRSQRRLQWGTFRVLRTSSITSSWFPHLNRTGGVRLKLKRLRW